MSGLIGKKLGMTSIFDASGENIPCTVIEVGPNIVTQIKTRDGKDGYDAIQLSFGEKKEKNTNRALRGHFQAAGTSCKRRIIEFRDYHEGDELEIGDEIRVTDVFDEGDIIDVVGISKGKGFQGVVKRHGFKGVGSRTHGQHNRERAPGSIGASSYPSRVFKGMRMGGRQGNQKVTMSNINVVRILTDQNLMLVKGAVPGPKGGFVELHRRY